MRKHLLIHALIISFVLLSVQIIQSAEKSPQSIILLRSSYRNLSVSQVQSMANMSIRKNKEWGFFGHSTISHDYDLKVINGDNVVIDHATGRMWHQSGSDKYMSWNKVNDWVKDLNSRGYAGYNDWRLPTVEEATSLLESSKQNNLYINSVFNDRQSGIWSGDSNGSDSAWYVIFKNGSVTCYGISSYGYVRPIRTIAGETVATNKTVRQKQVFRELPESKMDSDRDRSTSDFAFRKTEWGMSESDVKESEPLELFQEEEGLLVYKTKVLDKDVYVVYIFIDNQLVRSRYVLAESHSNENDYIDDYQDFKAILEKKYGKPLDDQTIWRNDLFKNEYSDWGQAISIGHLVLHSTWLTSTTEITNMLSGDNYEITCLVEYRSTNLKKIENKAAEKKALGDF